MPIVDKTSNKILPANARAADVADKAIKEITPVQQQRSMATFRVQGYQGILYSRLTQGSKCSCQSSQKQINTALNKDGKASSNAISTLITGKDTFEIAPYGASNWDFNNPTASLQTSPQAPGNQGQSQFDVVHKGTYPNGRLTDEADFGDNGPVDPTFSIEDLVGGFDASHMGLSDVSCAVCFGTGFVSGYSPFYGYRKVLTVTDVGFNGNVDFSDKPFSATASVFTFYVVLPKQPVGVDVFRVMYRHTPVNAIFSVDGVPIDSTRKLLSMCDGLMHNVQVTLPGGSLFTHVELQFNLSHESAFFEFPKISQGSDTSLREQFEPFQISLSPNIPNLNSQDVIVDSVLNKTMVVQSVSPWNSRNRAILGWECNVRVIQPSELYRILPYRGRVLTKPQTTVGSHDNLGFRRA